METTAHKYSSIKKNLKIEAISLLQQLIATSSFSKTEDKTADLIYNYIEYKNINCKRFLNNVWALNKHFDPKKPTLLLNSHHDTVLPNQGYTINPFEPVIQDGKLFGLGSNDAGASLVALLACFIYYYENSCLQYNLIYAATAEEEISGTNGIEALLPKLGKLDLAIVGEPTKMQLAVAEKGLMVLDCLSHGQAGHAARTEGDNALYKAIDDIQWFRNFEFPKISHHLGKTKMTVTVINAGNLHNVVPDKCSFTVDVRVTDCYTHENILEIIKKNVNCEIQPRSMRLRSSSIDENHPLVQAGIKLGKRCYGSPTSSDMALLSVPALKMGPGDSARSHTANEYVYLQEIEDGIDIFIDLLHEFNSII